MADVRRTRRAVALIGNTVALAALGLLFLLGGPRVFGTDAPPAPPTSRAPPGDARLLVVVVDALRDDTARDATLMPNLAALAGTGQRAWWWVDLLVPSTIGSLETLVEGRAPPAVAALRDFGARAAPGGGWLERAADAGTPAFVAGPDLWTERYGRWIGDSRVESGMPTAASDFRVARAARDALGNADAPRVVIAHLAELDATAHRHGADGPAWRAAARRIDAHLGGLLAAVTDTRAIVVLADHGVTLGGGHAGGEAAVRQAPIVVANLPDGMSVPCTRVDAHVLLSTLLAARPADGDPCRAAAPDREPTREPIADRAMPGGIALWLVVGSAAVVTGASSLAAGGVPGFALSAALWTAIGFAVASRHGAGAALIVASVSLAALLAVQRVRLAPTAAPTFTRAAAAVAFATGGALGAIAIAIAAGPVDAPSFAPVLPPALAAALVGLATGFAAGGRRSPVAAGIALVAAVAAAVHAGGETLSLSSVDVALAHRAAGLADGPVGIALAAPVALLRLVLPIAAVLIGVALGDARRRRGAVHDDTDPHARAVALATTFGLCQLGAIAVHAVALSRPTGATFADGLPLVAAGLGGLLRELVTGVLVFGALFVRGAVRRDVTRVPSRIARARFPRGT